MPTPTIIEMDLREVLAEMNKKLDRISRLTEKSTKKIVSFSNFLKRSSLFEILQRICGHC